MRINGLVDTTVTKQEITKAIQRKTINKAADPDKTRDNFIKLLNEENIDILMDLFNIITVYIPHDTTFSSLYQKNTHQRNLKNMEQKLNKT